MFIFVIMNVTLEHRPPTVREYQKLRASTTWKALPDKMVGKGLGNTLFSICVCVEGSIIGTGRVIGDGAMYFYIQDVIVLPEFRRTGIGMLIMKEIEAYLDRRADKDSFVGLMAADGVADFYHKFGYKLRPDNAPGMYKMIL